MSRLFLDTNALLDLHFARLPLVHEAMLGIVEASRGGANELLVSTLSLADATYVVENSRTFKEVIPSRQARRNTSERMRAMTFNTFEVCAIDQRVALAAHHNLREPDYDDALIVECAVRNNADVIVSSDASAFRNARIPGMTPEECLGWLEKERP